PPSGLDRERMPAPKRIARPGPMAEWLRRGLQILARRFDSGSGLHPFLKSRESWEKLGRLSIFEMGLSIFGSQMPLGCDNVQLRTRAVRVRTVPDPWFGSSPLDWR